MPLLAACATTVSPRDAPPVDYHQHLVSPAFAPIVKMPERDGAALVRELDAAGIEKAVVLSVGYSFADERKKLTDPDRLTREENDWTSAEVTKNTPRLIGFCSANPLRPVALEELERCLALPGMVGIKLHLGNAGTAIDGRAPPEAFRAPQLVGRNAPSFAAKDISGAGVDSEALRGRVVVLNVWPRGVVPVEKSCRESSRRLGAGTVVESPWWQSPEAREPRRFGRSIVMRSCCQCRGSSRRARVPPSGEVSSVTEPPYNSASSLTIARPSPDPGTRWSARTPRCST